MNNNEYRLMPVALLPAIRDALVETGKCFQPEHVWAAIIEAHDRVSPDKYLRVIVKSGGRFVADGPNDTILVDGFQFDVAKNAGQICVRDVLDAIQHWLNEQIDEVSCADEPIDTSNPNVLFGTSVINAAPERSETPADVRDAALEEAAKACDFHASWSKGEAEDEQHFEPTRKSFRTQQFQAEACAKAIRELKATPAPAVSSRAAPSDHQEYQGELDTEELDCIKRGMQRLAAPSPTGESLSAANDGDILKVAARFIKNETMEDGREWRAGNREILEFARALLATPSVQGVAAAGQELTDADIDRIVSAAVKKGDLSWLGYRKDEDGVYTVPVLSPGHYQLCRAIERHLSGDTAAQGGE